MPERSATKDNPFDATNHQFQFANTATVPFGKFLEFKEQ